MFEWVIKGHRIRRPLRDVFSLGVKSSHIVAGLYPLALQAGGKVA